MFLNLLFFFNLYSKDIAKDLFENLLSSIDSKIKKTQEKMNAPISEEDKPREVQEKIILYDLDIKRLLVEVERLGENGKLDEVEKV